MDEDDDYIPFEGPLWAGKKRRPPTEEERKRLWESVRKMKEKQGKEKPE